MLFVFLFFQFIIKKRNNDRLYSCFVKRNHVSIWNWIQKYRTKKLSSTKKRKIEEFIVDETLIKKVSSSEIVGLCWISIDIKSKEILHAQYIKRR